MYIQQCWLKFGTTKLNHNSHSSHLSPSLRAILSSLMRGVFPIMCSTSGRTASLSARSLYSTIQHNTSILLLVSELHTHAHSCNHSQRSLDLGVIGGLIIHVDSRVLLHKSEF